MTKYALPMRLFWTLYFFGMALLFTFAFVNTIVDPKGKVDPSILFCILLIICLFGMGVRWWLARILLDSQTVTMVKLFQVQSVPIELIDRFDFVTGRFGFYVYVGAIYNSKIVLKSSYGPVQNINSVRKSLRMTAYIAELNRSLESYRTLKSQGGAN